MELSCRDYWESLYEQLSHVQQETPPSRRIITFLKNNIGKKALTYYHLYLCRNYSDYLLWDIIYKRYLPQKKGLKVLEIGSAPGNHLVRLNQTFGFIPYGIEYTKSGFELNKKIFMENNLDPKNIIYGDFFDETFLSKYRYFFDIVISRGFIEHFNNSQEVVKRHLELLSEGGYLVVEIPNLRGLNYLFMCLFNKELIPLII